ncbi:hypothetical protein BKA62DRAFT_622263 [Auriculariales sp. MPI-PUGE-AT-0066]|nr:hypothetical protein BKA62DRAFT_622263 [Auriculariales sp. MPI-PUGE-AT-0066]
MTETTISQPLPDGYWVQSFNLTTGSERKRLPDLIAYGLGFKGSRSTIRLYLNPRNDGEARESGWKVCEVASLDFPIACIPADLNGNGFNDIIICDNYGPSMNDLWEPGPPNFGGRVIWLKNPCTSQNPDPIGQPFWEQHEIGFSTGMHRQVHMFSFVKTCLQFAVGHFSRTDVLQVMGCPIIARSGDFTSPAPVLLFTPTYEPPNPDPQSWREEIPYPDSFRLIHDMKLLPGTNGGLDMILVAGQEGIVLLWFDIANESWCHSIVGSGIPPPTAGEYKFWGSGGLEVCRVGDDPVGYIAAVEAFHGRYVSVYTKRAGAPAGAEALKDGSNWTRHIVKDFGLASEDGTTGPLHHTMAVPNSNSTTESFGVAAMGVSKPRDSKTPFHPRFIAENDSVLESKQGVFLYTPTDLSAGTFSEERISAESAGRIAVDDYSGTGFKDVASVSYYVPHYLTLPDVPSLRINTIGDRHKRFTAERLDDKVLIKIPRPSLLSSDALPTLPFWQLAGKNLAIVVLPHGQTHTLDPTIVAMKVIYGEVIVTDTNGGNRSVRRIAPPAKQSGTTLIPTPARVMCENKTGAVFIAVANDGSSVQPPFNSMSNVVSRSALPHTDDISPEVASLGFPFHKVQDLPWASNGAWNDFEFYNAFGFHVYFNDDPMDRICHIQAWTLGLGETRADLHDGTGTSFSEIHYCLSNGGGEGGMLWFPDDFEPGPDFLEEEMNPEWVTNNTERLVVPDFEEHGPLWKVRPDTEVTPMLLKNGAVDYPYHGWLSSRFGQYGRPPTDIPPPNQRFDVWLAFEFPLYWFQW